jgi:cytochrome P450
MNGAFANTVLLLGTSYPLQNPPAHGPARARLRDLIGVTLRRWTADKIDELAVQLLAPFDGVECMDAIQLLAKPLPATIIGDAVELGLEDVYRSGELSLDIVSLWSSGVIALRDLSAMERSATSIVELLMAKWGDDRRAEFAGLAFLMFAGVFTSSGLLGSAIHRLSRTPALQDRLRETPALVSGFVNEVLRCCPPASRILGYRAVHELTLSTVTIPEGAPLIIDIESAHHDPAAYFDPEHFDPAREGPPSLAFGVGAHACVGAVLARLEAKVLIERLLRDYAIFPAGDARLRASRDWYEYESVPIRLERI